MTQKFVGSIYFQRPMGRRGRRQPWQCLKCGAAVLNPRQHAAWHLSDKLVRLPVDCCAPEFTETMEVHIGDDGWPLR